MTIEHKISTLGLWSEQIESRIQNYELGIETENAFSDAILRTYQFNKWFTEENVLLALKNICEEFLAKEKLEKWMQKYSQFTNNGELVEPQNSKLIGITMAGNLPLVGFHDLLCVVMTNHKALIKQSSKDNILLPFLLEILFEIEPEFKKQVAFSDMLKGCDAYIATGSNNSTRYFEYYFGKYPHIIRKNRTSIAVLDGTESDEDLLNLGKDVFTYFGMGCRNVGKILITPNVDLQQLLKAFEHFNYLAIHDKYKNNFDYQLTLLLMNQTPCLANDCVILTENKNLHSPLSVLFYEVVDDLKAAVQAILEDDIQCVVGKDFIPFGQSQIPSLSDYADNVDTMKWLLELN